MVEDWGKLSRQTRVKTALGMMGARQKGRRQDQGPGRKAEDKTDGTMERRASRDQAQWHGGGQREKESERAQGRVSGRWQSVANTERRAGL